MTTPSSRLVCRAIEPRNARERAVLLQTLEALANDKPGHIAAIDIDPGPIRLEGETEAQLEAAVGILQTRYAHDLEIGPPQVVYRETLARRVEVDATHRKQIAGGCEYARVKIVFAPSTASFFEIGLPQGDLPRDFLAGVERGIARAFRVGTMAGFPIVDVAATLVDSAWHATDSTPLAFEKAAVTAVGEAQRGAGVLLEPIMRVEVVAPAPYACAVHGDLVARRANTGSPNARDDGTFAIAAEVPLADLLGYDHHLHRLTNGAGRLMIAFSHFAPIDLTDPPRFRPAAALRIA